MSGEQQGRRAAEGFRGAHHLGAQPLTDLVGVVERACGVDVAVVDHGNDLHGMTVRHGTTTLVGVARTRHPMRQRSTLAHEVGHLVFGDLDVPDGDAEPGARTPAEIRADAFARHLLVPLDGLRVTAADRPVDESLLSTLVQTFGASPHLVAIQLREAGFADPETSARWGRMTTAQLAVRHGWGAHHRALGTESDTLRPPRRLLARATRAYAAGVVSVALLARLSGTTDLARIHADLADAGIERATVEPRGDVPRPRRSERSVTDAELDAVLLGIDT